MNRRVIETKKVLLSKKKMHSCNHVPFWLILNNLEKLLEKIVVLDTLEIIEKVVLKKKRTTKQNKNERDGPTFSSSRSYGI